MEEARSAAGMLVSSAGSACHASVAGRLPRRPLTIVDPAPKAFSCEPKRRGGGAAIARRLRGDHAEIAHRQRELGERGHGADEAAELVDRPGGQLVACEVECLQLAHAGGRAGARGGDELRDARVEDAVVAEREAQQRAVRLALDRRLEQPVRRCEQV